MTPRTLALLCITLLVGAAIGGWISMQFSDAPAMNMDKATATKKGDGPCPGGAQPDYWVAPMDDNYRRDEPGKSPMGMDLVPQCASDGLDENQIAVSPATIQTLGVRTAPVQRAVLTPSLSAVGRIAADPAREKRVHSRAEGWVQDLGVSGDGDPVAPGDTLYTLFSPKFYSAESDYLAAAGHSGLQRAAADRLRALGYRDAQIKAIQRRGKATDTVQIQASTAHTVTALPVRAGQFVQPGTHLMTLAQLDTLWLLAEVEEAHIGRLREGQSASVTVSAYPGGSWSAQVARLASTLDTKTRTLPVRLVVDNSDGRLRPEMFARVDIAVASGEPVLSVPASSVIRDGRSSRVVKALGDGRFEVVAVELGQRVADRWEIRAGLDVDDEVVVQGQFMLDTETNVDAEALRISGAEAPDDGANGHDHDAMGGEHDADMRPDMASDQDSAMGEAASSQSHDHDMQHEHDHGAGAPPAEGQP